MLISYTLNQNIKTMKISFTLLAILVTLSVFVPFFIFIFKGLNNTTKTKHKAENLLKPNGFKYNLKEVWNNKFIGLTEDKKVLSYIAFKEDENQVFNLELSEIKSCEVISDYKKDIDKVTRLKHLDLKISFHTPNKEAVVISFFDTDEAFTEDYETRRIENWKDIIDNNLNVTIKAKMAS